MDFLKSASESFNKKPEGEAGAAPAATTTEPKKEGGGIFDSASNWVNEQAGGGAKGEAKEDHLDKAIDYVQENVFKQGQQSNESATDQAIDNQIADTIRSQYKTYTGSEFPIADKK